MPIWLLCEARDVSQGDGRRHFQRERNRSEWGKWGAVGNSAARRAGDRVGEEHAGAAGVRGYTWGGAGGPAGRRAPLPNEQERTGTIT